MQKSLLALAALSLFGCLGDDTGKDDTGPEDTQETGGTTPELAIDTVIYGYDTTQWTYEVDCIGWADTVSMYITQDTTSPWEETHELENTDYDPDGAWDKYELTLPITDDWEAQESGVNTLFGNSISCENPYCESTMVWQIKAFEGDTVADCVVWAGSDADVNIVMEAGCREITF